ncbi:MAG: LuxR C-terminal-related transcriptional regulator [Paraglaciecola sp.]|uniref:helix-turn-helix transcriptional regulator n=1 Tax=Paraglaciecola sp. TaxID=1920173 RepID=UPI003296D65B
MNPLSVSYRTKTSVNKDESLIEASELQALVPHVIRQLYKVEVIQPLSQVKDDVLQIIAPFVNADFIVWHSQLSSEELNQQLLLTEHGIDRNDVKCFNVKLDDSNVQHQLFVRFLPMLSEISIEILTKIIPIFLPLVAEIYRQNVIHSYYQKWKTWPFEQSYSELKIVDSSIQLVKAFDIEKKKYISFEEVSEGDHQVLERRMQLENKVFIDRFMLPTEIQKLTSKQKQICFYLKACYSNQQIADTLGISIKTVGNHLSAIYEKLTVSRQQLFQLLNSSD